MVDQTVAELVPILGKRAACAALGRSRATYYRHHRQSPLPARQPRAPRPQPRALSQAERDEVLAVLHQERFVDQAPASIYATLLDEGRYVCSVPTLYRVLRAADEVHERRRQASASSDREAGAGGHPSQQRLVVGHRAPRGANNRAEMKGLRRSAVAAAG